MINLTREEAQQIINAIEKSWSELCINGIEAKQLSDKAIETLRARLSAPEPERKFNFSTIEEAIQPVPVPTGASQLTEDEMRFADAMTKLIRAGLGKEAQFILKSNALVPKEGFPLIPLGEYMKMIQLADHFAAETIYLQAQREWQGLTDEEVESYKGRVGFHFVRKIEAQLKEKNNG